MRKGQIKLIVIIVVMAVLAALVIYGFFGPKGLWKETTKGSISDKFLKGIGDDEAIMEEGGLPQSHKESINLLKSTIERMLNSPKKNCFANYGSFPNLGEGGTSLEMSYDPNARATDFVIGAFGGKQVVIGESFKIEKMVPCVIAGTSTITENFDNSFLNDKSWDEKSVSANHFNPVQTIKILYKTGIKDFDGNHISVPELGEDIVNDEGNNLLDAGFIYKPDDRHICFFPTIYGNNICDGSSDDGLDDDCLGADPNEDISIPRQIAEGKLILC